MTTFYLVRHGAYENPQYLFPGRAEGYSLSDEGRSQVKKTAGYFRAKNITALYSSPLLRTSQTAEIMSSQLKLPVVFDERLTEVRTNLEGISMHKFDATDGELSYLPENQAKGAETMNDLALRMAGFIEEKRKEHEGNAVLVVTHGDPMRFVTMKYMGLPIDFSTSRTVQTPLAGGYRLDFDKNVVNVTKTSPDM